MPSRATLRGERLPMSIPSSAIEPLSGFRYPVTMLTKVVLPAPLAPIRLIFWPAGNIEGECVGSDHRAKALFEPAHRKNRVHGVAPLSAVSGAFAAEVLRLRRFLIQSEPMPRGRNRMTPRRKTPSTSCQVLGK